MPRAAHYVVSTHWDREWYESFQGFRMRLVSMLDEVFATLERDPAFTTFVMDGQVIPIHDYLEIRPEKLGAVMRYVREGRLKVGPWYVLPDEWLVSGESLVRNLQIGMARAEELGAPSSRAGFACDLFGHCSQLPQIFSQLGLPVAFIWRGTNEREDAGHSLWRGADGTVLPAYRFSGAIGYTSFAHEVRYCNQPDRAFDLNSTVEALVKFTLREAGRSPVRAILVFDGADHIEIEPQTSRVLAAANIRLAEHDIEIVQSDLDRYMDAVVADRDQITKTLSGELRETGRDPSAQDDQWLIPGVLSSRIHLKQKNAACEDELCLWAEPFSAFAAQTGLEYPADYLRVAWQHLLQNHPHDSICGCSTDQVHQDMLYRFDQSLGISSRLTQSALEAITRAAAPRTVPDGSLVLGVFNHTAADLEEFVDLDIPLPPDWPARFQEFFFFEGKFGFRLRGVGGKEIPYQLVAQSVQPGIRRPRYKFPQPDNRHLVSVTARLRIPAFGYTMLTVEPVQGPTRYLGTLATTHNVLENEYLHVEAASNGSLTLMDKRTGQVFDRLLTFEDRADIGDGWYHGVAVNDQIFTSAGAGAEIALIADGIGKATLRITVTMHVPAEFQFGPMTRSEETLPLKITSNVTLRAGSDRLEVATTVDNIVRDHRLRVLFPTRLAGDTYFSDSAFDTVERQVALAADNASRKELDVETRPQSTWTAFGNGQVGLAIVSRGLPESAVGNTPERPIALTLLRAFRRAVLSGDNPGGQIAGCHTFRYQVMPFAGEAPRQELFLRGQRVTNPVRVTSLTPADRAALPADATLPPEQSFLSVRGGAVVTSVQRGGEGLQVRLFNPGDALEQVALSPAVTLTPLTLSGEEDKAVAAGQTEAATITLPAKHITTVALGGP